VEYNPLFTFSLHFLLQFVRTSVYNTQCEKMFSFLIITYYLGMTPENTTPEEATLQTTGPETVTPTQATETPAENAEPRGKFDRKGGKNDRRNERRDH
jgi:hypothetical protein